MTEFDSDAVAKICGNHIASRFIDLVKNISDAISL